MNLLPPPGPQRTRSVVLLGLLAAVVVWMWWPRGPVTITPPVVSSTPGALPDVPGAAPASANNRQSPAQPQAVHLASLQPERRPLDVGRNLFRYGSRPLPPPPPAPPPPPMVQGPPPAPVPQGPPPVPLKLVGRVMRPDGMVVVTLKHAETGALFYAVEGDVVDGRYRLVKVGMRTVVVSYLAGSGQRTLSEGGL
jgi:hypothetical protein